MKDKARIIGRILRLLLGIFFITEVWPVYVAVDWQGAIERIVWALSLVIFYHIIHIVLMRFSFNFNNIVGAFLAFGPLLAVFFVGYGGPAATGALTFLSASLTLAAIRGDSGCEVMTIPAILSRKHTHLPCLLFSPIDWCERKIH
ncbi:MAG: hypothetical protein NXI20_11300 [bacterium]|nr:hypothetical protein [bacterium]